MRFNILNKKSNYEDFMKFKRQYEKNSESWMITLKIW